MQKLTAHGLTDVGLQRAHNEDTFAIATGIDFFVVCDGMGGHASGEVASRICAENAVAFVQKNLNGNASNFPYKTSYDEFECSLLSNAVQYANDRVYIEGMRQSAWSGRKNVRDTDDNGRFDYTDGVDLNRNYPFRWGHLGELGSHSNRRLYWYRGPHPGSEPETQTMADGFFLIGIGNVDPGEAGGGATLQDLRQRLAEFPRHQPPILDRDPVMPAGQCVQ